MARNDGMLSKEDEIALMNIHDHALKIASIAMKIIRLGSDTDWDPNSWWRYYDKGIQQQIEFLNSSLNKFNK